MASISLISEIEALLQQLLEPEEDENAILIDPESLYKVLPPSSHIVRKTVRGEELVAMMTEIGVFSKSLENIVGVCIHLLVHPDTPILETGEAMRVMEEALPENCELIFGTSMHDKPVEKIITAWIAT